MRTVLKNGIIVTEDKIIEGYDVVIEGKKIRAITQTGKEEAEKIVDCKGAYILPGLIDMHSDMIEALIQPRSTARFDMEMALNAAEGTLATAGITTMYHSLSMYRVGSWDAKEIRHPDTVRRLAKKIREHQKKGAIIHNRFHLRYEIDNISAYDLVKEMIRDQQVDLFSVMDHSPGQGQYRDLSIYRKHLPGEGKNLTDAEFEELLRKEQEKEKLTEEQIEMVVRLAQEKGIAVASHDDESVEKVRCNQRRKINISEFPITMEAAKEAVSCGQKTVLGAPNILLGGSHSGNLSAERAVKEGVASILVSDYYPQALLYAVFALWKKDVLSLPEAVQLATLQPAKATGIAEMCGSIKVGKYADLLVVREKEEGPFVEQVYVNGTKVVSCFTAVEEDKMED